jgi:hypothetical protein
MTKNLIPHEKAEFFTPEELDKFNLIGFKSELESLVEEISKLPPYKVFTIYIEGEYGSGKTLFIRKLLNELFKKNEKIIPFHIFIGGESGFKPFKSIENISLKIKEFIDTGKTSPVIVGNKEGWKNRLEIINEAIEQSKKQFVAEMQAFENFINYITKKGYIPAIFFDETERIFTREPALSGDEIKNFSYLLKEWHALTRGHKITPLVLGVSTTKSYDELIRSYQNINPDLDKIKQEIGIDFINNPSLFPLAPSMKTFYDKVLKMEWYPDTLKNIGEHIIDKTDVLRNQLLDELSKILRVPRALFVLKKPIEEIKETINRRFYDFEERLKREKIEINGTTKQLVASTSEWLNNAKKLIQNLCFRVSVKEENRIKEMLKVIEGNEEFLKTYESNKRKYKGKLFSLLYKLSNEIGIYEKVGDEYRLDSFLASYLLLEIGRDSFPDGSIIDLNRIIDKIKRKIKETRQKRKERRLKREMKQ